MKDGKARRRCPLSTSAFLLQSAIAPAALGVALLFSWDAGAQSAADKATARELASQGIKKLQAGDAQSAVTSLEKAQALYEAPVHLLYLGRAHTQLGNLVEAAESYRSLARAKIGPDAPAVFRKAQEEGAQELAELEPRIAKLTIDVVPEVAGLEVTVDGEPINTAALSVPRATNPGRRLVRVSAPGYKTAETEVTLVEGGSDGVELQLEEDPDAPPSPESAGQEDKGSPQGGKSEAGFETGPMGFIIGLRGGGVLPVGELETGVATTDYFQPGVAGRAEVGFRFLRHIGIKGYFGMGALTPGGELTAFAEEQDPTVVTKNAGGLTDAGVAVMATTDPRILGGFGEVGFSFLHRYQWNQSFSSGDFECEMKASYPGWAVRAGGGMNIPTGPIVDIVPAVDVSIGQFNERQGESNCSSPVAGDPGAMPPVMAQSGVVGADERFEGSFDSALHYQIFLGVGVDFHFGDQLF